MLIYRIDLIWLSVLVNGSENTGRNFTMIANKQRSKGYQSNLIFLFSRRVQRNNIIKLNNKHSTKTGTSIKVTNWSLVSARERLGRIVPMAKIGSKINNKMRIWTLMRFSWKRSTGAKVKKTSFANTSEIFWDSSIPLQIGPCPIIDIANMKIVRNEAFL